MPPTKKEDVGGEADGGSRGEETSSLGRGVSEMLWGIQLEISGGSRLSAGVLGLILGLRC